MSHLSRLRSLVEFALILSAVPALQSTVWTQQLQQTVETPVQAVGRAVAKYGAQWASGGVADWTAEGTVTMFGVDGSKATFNMTLMRKGSAQVQRIIKANAFNIAGATSESNVFVQKETDYTASVGVRQQLESGGSIETVHIYTLSIVLYKV